MDATIPSLIFAATLMAGQVPEGDSTTSASEQSVPTEVEAVVVVCERTREAAESFVRSVAAPVGGRKAAAWRNSVCVGVGGMRAEAAQLLVDRVSDWAHQLGLTVEPPGCRPQIFIVATTDGDGTARDLVDARPDDFRTGMSGADQGAAALERFQTSGRLIRWWHVSLPVDGDTGLPIGRLPGQPPFAAPPRLASPSDFGSYGRRVTSSLIADQTRDDLMQAIIVLDVAVFDQANFSQISDYVTMVALAQIQADAEPAYPSILRIFSGEGPQQESLTRWDQAYLRAVYGASQEYGGAGANLSSIALTLARELELEDQPD